jgi:hypothetical protein
MDFRIVENLAEAVVAASLVCGLDESCPTWQNMDFRIVENLVVEPKEKGDRARTTYPAYPTQRNFPGVDVCILELAQGCWNWLHLDLAGIGTPVIPLEHTN